MLSVRGIFDGQHIYPTEVIHNNKRCPVIITFIEEADVETDTLHTFGTTNAAVDFWEADAEDVYQDYLPRRDMDV